MDLNKHDWKYITTIDELEHIALRMNRADVIAVDTETTGLDPHTAGLRLIQFAVSDEPVYVVDCFALMPQRDVMIPDLKKNKLVEVARLEFACIYGVASMEYDGIHLNMDKWQALTGVIAQYSQDQRMLQAYRNGEDLHKLTASLMMQKSLEDVTKEERQAAKAVNFGLVFGMGAAGLKAYAADTYGSAMTLEEAELFKKRFFEGYRGVDRWQRQIRRHLPEEERTLAGRKFRFRKEAGLSGRYNTPIQGTAADILKNALGMLPELLCDKDTCIAAVVHDEIVLECPKEIADQIAELLTETMEQAGAKYLRDVPVVAEASVADSWAGK